ncbi:MAG: alpha/beta hydrolase [Hydrocarboniphaga sp.]|uniref:alpha/beta hydrolase n=1 Tax=Hydrocarboniphaga sp. TaxID=2033016 RepID=UPI00260B126F|nr:alpha/beta fold hydrolase [Hydrocarboniphaga sp.]MDB5972578.1 alpha/beta hydrolase [Hydrocarboniphaga sp.]
MSQPAGIRDHSFFYEGGNVGVLLIHGLTGTPVEMRYVGRGLHKSGYTVYGVQLPGHCGTEDDLAATGWKDWYRGVELALNALLTRVDKVFIGGLSMGAVMSLYAASQHPDKVSGLLLYGPTIWYDGWSIPWYSILWKPLINTPIGRNYRFMERHPYGIKDERLRKRVVQNMLAGNSADAGLAGMPAFSVRQMWGLVDEVKCRLPSIRTPALVMHSLEDDVCSVKNARYIQKRIGGAVELRLLNDCYHMITVDRQRDVVLADSIGFLQAQAVLGPCAAAGPTMATA